MEMKVETLICKDCGGTFISDIEEQKRYAAEGWQLPVRCKKCRRLKKILNLALKEKMSISEEVEFPEICDGCHQKFFSKRPRNPGENIYCDDCWIKIKVKNETDTDQEDREKG